MYRCEACGGAAIWRPSKQQVLCRSCSTAVPLAAADTTPPASFALVTWLRDTPENRRTFTPPRVELPCPTCSHTVVFEPAIEGTACPACQTPLLRPPVDGDLPIRPTGVVPFRIDEADARESLRAWLRRFRGTGIRSRRLEPGPLEARYVPYWRFSARVHCPWRHTAKGSDGRTQVSQGEVTGTYGEHEPGSHTVPADLLRTLPKPFEHALAYDRRYLAGATVEHYDADMFEAWMAARGRLEALVNRLVDKDSGVLLTGPAERWPSWLNEKGWLILTPFYTTTIEVRGERHQVVIDGHGGQIATTAPVYFSLREWLMVAAVVAGLIGLLAGFFMFFSWLIERLGA